MYRYVSGTWYVWYYSLFGTWMGDNDKKMTIAIAVHVGHTETCDLRGYAGDGCLV